MFETIEEAVVAAWAAMPEVRKTQTANTGKFSYSFASLPEVLAAVRPVLAGHGLAVLQSTITADGRIGVETWMLHTSGQRMGFGTLSIQADRLDAQQIGSWLTYARRYGVLAACGIAPDDDDGATASRPARRRPAASDEVRELIAGLGADEGATVRDRFVEHFGCRLSELPVERHGEALRFVRSLVSMGSD